MTPGQSSSVISLNYQHYIRHGTGSLPQSHTRKAQVDEVKCFKFYQWDWSWEGHYSQYIQYNRVVVKIHFMTIVQFTMGKSHLDTDGRISQQIDSLLSIYIGLHDLGKVWVNIIADSLENWNKFPWLQSIKLLKFNIQKYNKFKQNKFYSTNASEIGEIKKTWIVFLFWKIVNWQSEEKIKWYLAPLHCLFVGWLEYFQFLS